MHMMMTSAKPSHPRKTVGPCCRCSTPEGKRHKSGTPERYSGVRFGEDGELCFACYQWHRRQAERAAQLNETEDPADVRYLPDEATLRKEREAKLATDLDAEGRDMKRLWATQDENAARARDERAKVKAEREAGMVGVPRVSHQLGCLPFEEFDAMVKVRSIGRAMFMNTVRRNPELQGAAFG